jgi:hypothetical protein
MTLCGVVKTIVKLVLCRETLIAHQVDIIGRNMWKKKGG